MTITPEQARKALKDLCAFSSLMGRDADLGCVRKLHLFIEQVEKKDKTPALFKPPVKET